MREYIPIIQKKVSMPSQRYIKPHSIKQLELSYFAWKYRDSNIPAGCRFVSKFRDDSANNLTKCIQAWCKVNGAHFQRQNSQGQFDPRLNIWRKSGSTRGISDALIIYKGQTINIEIKYGKDKQSDRQMSVQASIESAGGIYWIVRDYDEFLNQINEIL